MSAATHCWYFQQVLVVPQKKHEAINILASRMVRIQINVRIGYLKDYGCTFLMLC